MVKYILKRMLHLVPVLLGVSILSFVFIHLSPGDYLSTISLDPTVSPERIARLKTQFGLDQPWYVQYGLWLYNLSPYQFPFGVKYPDPGYSFSTRMPVLTLLQQRFWNTIILTLTAECVIWLVAIPIALYLASRKNRWMDHVASAVLFVGISVPQVLLALGALLLAAKTGWFPIGGMHNLAYENLTLTERWIDLLHHLILPVAVLATSEMISMIRYARTSLVETLGKEFILCARAKGLSPKSVLLRHALPNARNPLLSLLGMRFTGLISASILVEIIMGWPGIGRLTYDAILTKDIYVIMGTMLAGTLLLVTGNLIADILLGFSDPRIRHE